MSRLCGLGGHKYLPAKPAASCWRQLARRLHWNRWCWHRWKASCARGLQCSSLCELSCVPRAWFATLCAVRLLPVCSLSFDQAPRPATSTITSRKPSHAGVRIKPLPSLFCAVVPGPMSSLPSPFITHSILPFIFRARIHPPIYRGLHNLWPTIGIGSSVCALCPRVLVQSNRSNLCNTKKESCNYNTSYLLSLVFRALYVTWARCDVCGGPVCAPHRLVFCSLPSLWRLRPQVFCQQLWFSVQHYSRSLATVYAFVFCHPNHINATFSFFFEHLCVFYSPSESLSVLSLYHRDTRVIAALFNWSCTESLAARIAMRVGRRLRTSFLPFYTTLCMLSRYYAWLKHSAWSTETTVDAASTVLGAPHTRSTNCSSTTREKIANQEIATETARPKNERALSNDWALRHAVRNILQNRERVPIKSYEFRVVHQAMTTICPSCEGYSLQ